MNRLFKRFNITELKFIYEKQSNLILLVVKNELTRDNTMIVGAWHSEYAMLNGDTIGQYVRRSIFDAMSQFRRSAFVTNSIENIVKIFGTSNSLEEVYIRLDLQLAS